MSTACLRCGFPNEERAMHCRACSAPLQDGSNEATIKPRLRQIIAETRARTRARQRRGVSVDPNRVDVVPRLPSGVAASDAALKAALEKGRQARLQGLREELRKGRPDFSPPAPQSVPPHVHTAPPKPITTAQPPKSETTPSKAGQNTDQIAEDFLNQTPKYAAEPTLQKPVARHTEASETVAPLDTEDLPSVDAFTAAEPSLEEIEAQSNLLVSPTTHPPLESSASTPSAGDGAEIVVAPETAQPKRTNHEISSVAPSLEAQVEGSLEPASVAASGDVEELNSPAQKTLDDRQDGSAEPALKPLLSAAAKTALHRLRQTANRLKGVKKTTETAEVENACGLYGRRRFASTLVDGAPVLILALVWLSAQLNTGQRPPEEMIASWLLGESGGTPWGLISIGIFWLVWCWAGIAVWGVTPGMRTAGLQWYTHSRWKRFARPPLFLISLLPLGLGGTYALLDKNSRGLSDVILRLTWYRN